MCLFKLTRYLALHLVLQLVTWRITGVIKMENRSSSITEPCGTPDDSFTVRERQPPTTTNCSWPAKYDARPGGRRLLWSEISRIPMWLLVCFMAILSRIFPMVLRFVIGRKFAMSVVHAPGFFNRGVTWPTLYELRNTPSENERLARFEMMWP